MQNNYKNITMNELNLLFLESRYNQINLKTYGIYQDRAKIVNEYLGDLKVKYVDSKKIDEFRDYLLTKRKWKYTKKVSERTVDNVLQYLKLVLENAVSWRIILVNPMKEKVTYKKYVNESDEEFIKERYELLSNIEHRRISNTMDTLLNN